jgi:hypothetical protein
MTFSIHYMPVRSEMMIPPQISKIMVTSEIKLSINSICYAGNKLILSFFGNILKS